MLGLRSCIFQHHDIVSVADWYEKVLQKKPYFTAERYIGFDVGGYELGIFQREEALITPGTNIEIYWGVESVESELQRLIELWATQRDAPTEVGGGIVMASVIDPFWNIFGMIYNPIFKASS